MQINTQLHTIFMLVGPSECGKTTFAKEYLLPKLQYQVPEKNYRRNVQYISSDELRQELLGYAYDKYEQTMLEASNQAFPYLRERLSRATSYPISCDFAIVDTTGLAAEFRQEIQKIAKEQHYHVEAIVFDYSNREDYYSSERSKKMISSHIQRLKREVLPVLSREGYDGIHRIKSKDFTDIQVEVQDQELFDSCLLPEEPVYSVIGDVHECVDTLSALVQKLGYQVVEGVMQKDAANNELPKLILNGDWIDKGKKTAETIEFLYRNHEHFLFTLGNHENFVYHYLKGAIKGAQSQIIDEFFDSIEVLQKQPDLLAKFNFLVELSKPFYKKIGSYSRSFIVTHAPCKEKYLGKIDTLSLRNQRNFRINREEELQPQLDFIQAEASFNGPIHVFGHIAALNAFKLLNKQHIDTGAVYQNKLTAVTLYSFKIVRQSVPSSEGEQQPLPALFEAKREVAIKELGSNDYHRLLHMADNQVNYVSGTMSPADKNSKTNELESLAEGLAYFRNKGVKELVLQPKYMGSRCTVYLNQEVEKCYAVSRNGYLIRQIDLVPIFEELQGRFTSKMHAENIDYLVLDGELLPWSAMGEGLIQKKFKPIAAALQTELSILAETGFEAQLSRALAELASSDYEGDKNQLSKKELIGKYTEFNYQQYKALVAVKPSTVKLPEHQAAADLYQTQVELYGSEAPLSFKAFNLLKIVYLDGEEVLPTTMTTSEIYQLVSDDELLKISLTDNEQADLEQAQGFFEHLTFDRKMEGVVLKPEVLLPNTVPFLKVRNTAYLSLVYGYDYLFPHKYQKLLKQKNTRRKLQTSLKEYTLGQKLLSVPLVAIKQENQAYLQDAANLLFEVAKEKTLDPRL